jgi:hypothetical protein
MDRLPRFHVSQADFDREQLELKSLEDTRTYLLTELTRIQEQFNLLWEQNRRLARRISYVSASERFYLQTARNYGRSALDRYVASLITQRLKEERTAPLRQEQTKIITELWNLTEQRLPIQRDIVNLTSQIRQLEAAISRKVVSELRRVELNLYVIIEERVKVYERAYAPGEKRSHGRIIRRHYPKGKFQCIFQLDSFIEPATDTVLTEQDPLQYFLDPANRNSILYDAIDRLFELFTVSFAPHQFTIGVTNLMAPEADRGRPPKIINVARSVEGPVPPGASPRESWSEDPDEFIMSQLEYNTIIEPMTEYVEELKRLGAYQGGLL